jgi:hypothetical protein
LKLDIFTYLSSKPKHPKLVFKKSIDRLKSYLYYLLLVVAAGDALHRMWMGHRWRGHLRHGCLSPGASGAVLTNAATLAHSSSSWRSWRSASLTRMNEGRGTSAHVPSPTLLPLPAPPPPSDVPPLPSPPSPPPRLPHCYHVGAVSRVVCPLLHCRQPIRNCPPLGCWGLVQITKKLLPTQPQIVQDLYISNDVMINRRFGDIPS